MKKVGIMTMHRVINYGSFLQAYGLKKMISSLGYSVEFIDYKYEKSLIISSKGQSIISKIFRHLNILEYLKYKLHTKKFSEAYHDYLRDIGVAEMNYNHDIDALVIGSDEVFNCIQPYPVGYSRNLFGYEYEDRDVISYGASFGFTTLELLKKYGIGKEVACLLTKFKSLSVRDHNSYEIVKRLTHVKTEFHLDPVLVSDFSDELLQHEFRQIQDFIVIYVYPNRLSKQEKKYIKSFAKKNKKKIVSLGFYQSIADYNLIINPFEVLSCIKKADFVITDTFHGTVFSIKMNTKFCVMIRESNKNKLESLLEFLNHPDRAVNQLSDIDRLYNSEINFERSNEILKRETKKSICYLKSNLD